MAYNLLVVDDSKVLRSVIIRTIRMSGLDVGEIQQAGDGGEALKILENSWVDMILADIHMPGMNGVELLKRLKEHPTFKTIPVLVISSDSAEERIQEMLSLGALNYLKKPFTPEGLRDMLEQYL